MAVYLDTLEHLAILSKKDPAVVENDPFAQLIMERATELCISAAGIPSPEWEPHPPLVPGPVRTICLFVAFRTYNNPKSVINSGVGPISESILAQHAAAMTLTEAEEEELGAIGEENGVGGLWVLSTTGGTETLMETQHLPDNSPTDWWIPYFANGDVGTEWDETTPPPPEPGGSGGTYDGPTMAQYNALLAQVNALTTTKADVTAVTPKADKTYVDTQLAGKASTASVASKADQSSVDALTTTVAGKADTSTVNAALATKADAAATSAALASKADTSAMVAADNFADARLDAIEAELPNKVDVADLGPQIHVGTDAPPSGSGELWADTDG